MPLQAATGFNEHAKIFATTDAAYIAIANWITKGAPCSSILNNSDCSTTGSTTSGTPTTTSGTQTQTPVVQTPAPVITPPAPVITPPAPESSPGCFSAGSLVEMASGVMPIEKLHIGDQFKNGARLRYLIKFNGSYTVYEIAGNWITAWHPFRFSEHSPWSFPIHRKGLRSKKVTTVYNLILDSNHVVTLNGTQFVTLGHGLKEPGVAHPYFGNMLAVLRDFAPHAKDGFVEATNTEEVEDESGAIIGYKFDVKKL